MYIVRRNTKVKLIVIFVYTIIVLQLFKKKIVYWGRFLGDPHYYNRRSYIITYKYNNNFHYNIVYYTI